MSYNVSFSYFSVIYYVYIELLTIFVLLFVLLPVAHFTIYYKDRM